MLKSINKLNCIFVAVIALNLWGCSSTNDRNQASDYKVSLVSASQSPNDYLARASRADSSDNRQRYLLLAANAYLKANNTSAADDILKAMESNLSDSNEIQAEHMALSARVLEQQSKIEDALVLLNYPTSWQLADWQWAGYYQIKARLYEANKQPKEQAVALARLSQYLPVNATSEVNDQIWDLIKPLSEETIQEAMNKSSDTIINGWLQLAYTAKHYTVNPSTLVRKLSEWQQQNPYHPAAINLPSDLQRTLETKPYQPSNIAVLLPLTGKYANVSNSVRQGILTSYLSNPDSSVSLNFFDTNEDVEVAYKQALEQGAEFVIGPLLQANVNKIEALLDGSEIKNAPPQLFLNHSGHDHRTFDRYFFALSPSQEAADTAQRMYNDKVEIPLLLASNNEIGKRMVASFNKKWEALTNTTAEAHYYDAGDEMRNTVSKALGVIDSKERIANMKGLIGYNIETAFRSRQDIDAIYMVSSSKDIYLLKPFIDVNFSVFSQPVPLYTSSRAHQEDNTQQTAIELDNIIISDIPWLIEPDENINNIKKLWPKWSNPQIRLYAMGIDSLQLINKLAQMQSFPGYQYNGYSGVLAVGEAGIIDRQLNWATYNKGTLNPL